VANGGVRRPLHIIDRVIDDEGRVVYSTPKAEGTRVISEKTAAVMNEMLKAVVVRGTGQNAALSEHVVARKTGTAQKAGRGGYSADRFVASFAGYVPADRPRLVIVAVVDEPRGAQYGGTVAAPVFQEVAEAALRYLRVEPSAPGRQLPVVTTQLAAFSQNRARSAVLPASSPRGAATVPDLRGLDARAAMAGAVRSGFEAVTEGSGIVTEQEPAAGSAVTDRRLKLKMKSPWESTR
jgi:cell division protein FtsI (penicillin-binding protein 3)